MKLLIGIIILVTALALASDDGNEENETLQDDNDIIVVEPQRDKSDCVVVEVCDVDGNCNWKITCP